MRPNKRLFTLGKLLSMCKWDPGLIRSLKTLKHRRQTAGRVERIVLYLFLLSYIIPGCGMKIVIEQMSFK